MKSVPIPEDIDRQFFDDAKSLLGSGYISEYYEANFVGPMRESYRWGFEDGRKRAIADARERRAKARRATK